MGNSKNPITRRGFRALKQTLLSFEDSSFGSWKGVTLPRANRHCSLPGCLSAISRNGRCAEHQFERTGSPWERNGSFYGERLPDKLRILVLSEAEYTCRNCRHFPSKEVDHIIPKFLGGTDDRSNLQCLCSKCHGIKSSAEGRMSRSMKRID